MALIAVQNLGVAYGTPARTVLTNINLSIEEGEFVCLLGQTGCGKSTLLKMILGAEVPASGRILIDGVHHSRPDRSRGYVPFNEYPVDFFLALPDQAATQAVRARLEPEFSVDIKPMQDDAELPFSLHATKSMRLILPDMQALSARMTALATEFKGRYDGWAA